MNTGSRRGPTLRRHKRSGRGYAKFNGLQVWFGPYDDRETHAEFAAYKPRWEANGRELPEELEGEGSLTVEDLCDQYEAHLQRRHDERWIANNLTRVKLALKPLRALYGPEDASTFSPLRLQAVRQKMLATEKLCRGEINDRVQIVRRAFKWAVAQEKVPSDLAHGLAAVESLRAGEYEAREGRKVQPVAEHVVWATLPYLSRQSAAVVELLWWTGARPSEVLGLRPKDIDRPRPGDGAVPARALVCRDVGGVRRGRPGEGSPADGGRGLSYAEAVAGVHHTVARRSDGSVVAWGANHAGQCNVPALPPGLGYVEVAASESRTVARVGPSSSDTRLGVGCSGSMPASRLVPLDTPRAGATLEVRLFDLPQSSAILLFSAQTASLGLGSFGLPGCTLHTGTEVNIPISGAGGGATFTLPIPTGLPPGIVFHQQAIVFDPAAGNGAGFVMSDAMAATIGA